MITLASISQEKREDRCVVRLTTSFFKSGSRVVMQKSLNVLKKMSVGFNIMDEDVSMSGVEDFFDNLTNINDCPDGIYLVSTCNESTDWESGFLDDYDYVLIPYQVEKKG